MPTETAPVTIYTRQWCGFCTAARKLLDQRGVTYEDKDATYDKALREEMIQRSGRATFPQVFIGDTHVGGCDDLMAAERTGALDRMLAA